MDNRLNYLEIFKYEQEIEVLVNHNIKKYKYVGEEGKEYEVIQSVFFEINKLPELTNKQILWYSIIINLVTSFYNQRVRGHLPDSLIVENPYGFKTGTKVKKSLMGDFAIPPYIELLEFYVKQIARMGILASAKKEIKPAYFNYKLDRINSLLTNLLKDMDSRAKGETGEEVFILTIKNAADNVLLQLKNLPENKEKSFIESINSEIYKRLIIKRIENIDRKRLNAYYNMEAFWNGFLH